MRISTGQTAHLTARCQCNCRTRKCSRLMGNAACLSRSVLPRQRDRLLPLRSDPLRHCLQESLRLRHCLPRQHLDPPWNCLLPAADEVVYATYLVAESSADLSAAAEANAATTFA